MANGKFRCIYTIHGSYGDGRSKAPKKKKLPKGYFELQNPSWICFCLTDSDPMGTYFTPLNSPPFAGRVFFGCFPSHLGIKSKKTTFRSFRCSEIPQGVQVVDPKYFFLRPKSPARKVGAPCHSTCFGVKKNQNYQVFSAIL